jgi:3-methyladenine DNA glycosylase AlkD
MSNSAAVISRTLQAAGDTERAVHAQRYFKTGKGQYGEGDVFLGIRVPELRRFAVMFSDTAHGELVELLQSPFHEARLLALLILVRGYQRGDSSQRKAIFDLYLANTTWINNWDLVDLSAPNIVGGQLGPGKHALLTRLAKSTSLWERRIAILATAAFIRAGYYDETLRISALLLHDEHDLIHKAVGWMLREVGKKDRAVEEQFLEQHAAHMPRTMLRYAIEKFPPALRSHYMRTK